MNLKEVPVFPPPGFSVDLRKDMALEARRLVGDITCNNPAHSTHNTFLELHVQTPESIVYILLTDTPCEQLENSIDQALKASKKFSFTKHQKTW